MSTVTRERQEVAIGESKFSFDPGVRIHVVTINGQPVMVYVLRNGNVTCFSETGPVDLAPDLRPKITAQYFDAKQDS